MKIHGNQLRMNPAVGLIALQEVSLQKLTYWTQCGLRVSNN